LAGKCSASKSSHFIGNTTMADPRRSHHRRIPLSTRPIFTRATPMTTIFLWLLIIAIGVYLLIAMLRPDKF
jgi:K+-transporting ATPase KdpF subunit